MYHQNEVDNNKKNGMMQLNTMRNQNFTKFENPPKGSYKEFVNHYIDVVAKIQKESEQKIEGFNKPTIYATEKVYINIIIVNTNT